MKLHHLNLIVDDVAACQAFYTAHFGFSAPRGPGFLVDRDGFTLVLQPGSPAPGRHPEQHHGFHCASRAELERVLAGLTAAGVPIADALKEQNGTAVFFCHDPAGHLVEVRSPAA